MARSLRLLMRPVYWLWVVVLLLIGAYLPYKLVWWIPDLSTLRKQAWSAGFRFALAYLFLISAWVALLLVIGERVEKEDPEPIVPARLNPLPATDPSKADSRNDRLARSCADASKLACQSCSQRPLTESLPSNPTPSPSRNPTLSRSPVTILTSRPDSTLCPSQCRCEAAQRLWRRLKADSGRENKRLIGTTEVVP